MITRRGWRLSAVVAVGFAIGFQANLSPGLPLVFPGSGEARAQGLTICGLCCSGDTACWERRRRDFEQANPPRGQIGGVCWVALYRDQKDADGKTKREWRSGVYSKVRFNETEVLSSDLHGRTAGFEYTVRSAWEKYVREHHPRTDADRGWSDHLSCVALNAPRGGDKAWDSMREAAAPTRVHWPEFGVADTPEERAREARAAEERKAKLAAEARAKAAAEAERRAAEQRAIAARQARVDSIARAIGPAKRADAERLQKLNEELAALRPKPVARPLAKPSPTPSSPARQCTRRTATHSVSHTADTREKAQAGLSRANGNIGGSETIVSKSLGAASCTQRAQLVLKPPPVGNCLACVSESLAATLGWVKGKGWPPPKSEWVCTAPLTFTAERCGPGTSKVRQE